MQKKKKKSICKCKKIEIIPSIFSDRLGMRLEINYKGKKIQKTHKHTEIKQHATEESMCQ